MNNILIIVFLGHPVLRLRRVQKNPYVHEYENYIQENTQCIGNSYFKMLFEGAADIHQLDVDIFVFFLNQVFQHINCVAKPETLR